MTDLTPTFKFRAVPGQPTLHRIDVRLTEREPWQLLGTARKLRRRPFESGSWLASFDSEVEPGARAVWATTRGHAAVLLLRKLADLLPSDDR